MRDPALQGEAKRSETLESGLVQLSDVSLVKILPQSGLKMPITVYATRVVSPTIEYQQEKSRCRRPRAGEASDQSTS